MAKAEAAPTMITPPYYCLLHHLCQGISNVKGHQLFKDKFTYSWSQVGILMGPTFALKQGIKFNQDCGAPAAPLYLE